MSLFKIAGPSFVIVALGCAGPPTTAPAEAITHLAVPVAPAGARLTSGVASKLYVGGSLEACGLESALPSTVELIEGPKNGPMDTYTLQMDPAGWTGWDARPSMDMMSLPAGSGMAGMATAELGRAPTPASAYGIAGGYESVGDNACDVHLYAMIVEPTADGFQITEVARRATVPPQPFDDSDPASAKVCGLDRARMAEVAPCGTRITKVVGVHAPEVSGPLSGARLLGAAGLARGMASWSETEAQLVARLGPATRVDGKHYTWAVRDGDTCVWFDVEKGWPAPIMGDGRLDPAELVGTVTEPYAAVDGAPYYSECMALTAG